jgi:endoglucanase
MIMPSRLLVHKKIVKMAGMGVVVAVAVIISQATVDMHDEHQIPTQKPISITLPSPVLPPTKLAAIPNPAKALASVIPAPQTIKVPPVETWRGQPLFVSSDNSVASYGTTSGNAKIARIGQMPIADWVGDWTINLSASVSSYVTAAAQVRSVPVLVLYNIPNRDCGSYSAGGAASPTAYNAWIQSVAAAIADKTAVVILEPDALAGIDCLPSAQQDQRLSMLAQAVTQLKSNPHTSVYIDAGNPGWQTAATMAKRLSMVNIAEADGFSLNVSNFRSNSQNTVYGSALSTLTSGKHFVIDTSRNGAGAPADGDWCNPSKVALGSTPTTETGNHLVDAYLWLKVPGESDGACGSAIGTSLPPAAGTFWPEYASMLAQNAGW